MKLGRSLALLLTFACVIPVLSQLVEKRSLAQVTISEAERCGNFGSVRTQAIDCIVLGKQLQDEGFVEQAINAYDKAIQYDKNLAIAYYSRGVAQIELKQWEAAISSFQSATRLNPNLRDAYRQWDYALRGLGRASEAGEIYRQATEASYIEGAMGHKQQGDLLWQQGQWNEAIPEYEAFIQLNPNWPDAYNRLGIAYYNRPIEASRRIENFEAAIEAYGTAIALCNQPEIVMYNARIVCSNNITVYYQNLATVYRTLGEFYTQRNLPEQARIAYAKEIEMNPDLIAFRVLAEPSAKDYNALGRVLHSQKRYQEAIEAYNKAIQNIETQDTETTNRELAAAVYIGLGLTLDRTGDQEGAISSYRQAVELNPTPAQYRTLASALKKAERWDELVEVYRKFEVELTNLEAAPASSSDINLETLLVDQERFREYLSGAEGDASTADSALKVSPANQDPYKEYTDLANANATKQDYYSFYIDQLMDDALSETMIGPDISARDRALEISERGRGRALLNFLTKAQAIQLADPELGQRKLILEQDFQRLVNQLSSARRSNTISQTVDLRDTTENFESEIVQQIEQIRQQYTDLTQQICTQEPRYCELDPPTPITVKEIQSALDDETLLLEYWLGEQASYLWVVSKDQVKPYKLPKRAKIDKAVEEFYQSLSNPAFRIEPNKGIANDLELSNMILGPAATDEQLDGKRLLIVADGKLQSIPFSALPMPQSDEIDWNNPPDRLVRHYEIMNIPSASTLTLMRRRVENRPLATKPLALVIDPQLSGAQQEAEVIREEADDEGIGEPSVLLEDFYATRGDPDNLLGGSLSQYRLIHFAMHGVLDDADPASSGLIFPNLEGDKAFLTLADVFKLPPLSADLIVLGGCRTGLGSPVEGEGLIGLTKGFMYAGAERVLVSLWSVRDDATSELMASFYDELIDHGRSPSEALRKAQLEMLDSEERNHPYYWAAFTLQGEWRDLRQGL